jgi:hypothetical protein
MRVMDVLNSRNRQMTTPAVSQQQKAAQAWIKLRAKRAAAVDAKPMKHGKKIAK